MNHLCGIYAIVNLVNGHFYVGSSVNVHRRFRDHRKALRNGNHPNSHLQRAWNKHGPDAFEFRVLLVCDPEKLHSLEGIAIEGMRPTYNLIRYVSGSVVASEETRARMSASRMGHATSDDTRAKIVAALTGRKFGAESIARMSEAHTGRPGHPVSEGTKAKTSAALMGHTVSHEARKKMSEASKGRVMSAETRAKISAATTGRKKSPETRAAMREAQRIRNQR